MELRAEAAPYRFDFEFESSTLDGSSTDLHLNHDHDHWITRTGAPAPEGSLTPSAVRRRHSLLRPVVRPSRVYDHTGHRHVGEF
jgi:hypothetical protein